METPKQDIFSFVDFTLEDAIEADKISMAKTEEVVREICVCGHGLSRHKTEANETFCTPSRMTCPCRKERAVMEVSDVRPFLRKTTGQGPFHALGRGMKAAVEAGVDVKWIIEMKCDRCEVEGPIAPVAVTENGIASSEPQRRNKLLCRECRSKI